MAFVSHAIEMAVGIGLGAMATVMAPACSGGCCRSPRLVLARPGYRC
jgi:hypothetical protein